MDRTNEGRDGAIRAAEIGEGAETWVGTPLIDVEAELSPPPQPIPPRASMLARVVLGTSLVLVALNLRPVFSSVSVLLPEILQGTGLQPWAGSLLTSLPVLCLGLFASLAPRLAGRFGAERTIMALLLVLCLGTAIRGVGSVPLLLAGAVLAGGSIAVVNVLLPGLVKRDFPDRVALMTGLYTMALSLGAAAAAGFTVPLEHALGSWPRALEAWAIPAAVVAALWLPQALGPPPVQQRTTDTRVALWRNRIAWRITLFMGMQSALAYCVFGYLAPMLRERGVEAVEAGFVVSVSVLLQCVACLVAPAIAVRRPDQRIVNVSFFAAGLTGLFGCMFAPLGGLWLWACLLGLGQGALIALAMTAIVLRSPDPATAARVSSMAQSVGYTLASGGPLAMGLLRGWTGSYAASAVLFAGLGTVGLWAAYGTGRPEMIEVPGAAVAAKS